MLEAFLTHINEKELFNISDKILLTVSGGKDSMVLFELFCRAKINFGVAHCNFQLRGTESDDDEGFVRQRCDNQGITFYSERFDTKEFAKENHLSTQLSARKLRYDWFEQIRQKYGYDYIATAHHLNDVVETVLLNLCKGTGIAGLHGIPAQNGHVVRPFLFATRAEIDEYAEENDLLWREDSSNKSNDYQRNLLRNEVIPLLKKINPNLEETFQRNVARFMAAEKIVKKEIKKISCEILPDKSVLIKINSIKSCESSSYVLEEFLKKYNFNASQSKNIFNALDSQSGKQFHSATHTLTKDRENLLISEKNKVIFEEILIEENTKELSVNNSFFIFNNLENNSSIFEAKNKDSVAEILIDADKISYPICLRKWRNGDWFIPLGMKGKKKISDYLIDKKIPISSKNNILLLTSQEQVIWVVGHRLDDRFKVTETTKRILRIAY